MTPSFSLAALELAPPPQLSRLRLSAADDVQRQRGRKAGFEL